MHVAENEGLAGRGQPPHAYRVAQLGCVKKARCPDERTVPLYIVAGIYIAYAAQMVGERLVSRKLVGIAQQTINTDVEAGHFAFIQIETTAGSKLAGHGTWYSFRFSCQGIVSFYFHVVL